MQEIFTVLTSITSCPKFETTTAFPFEKKGNQLSLFLAHRTLLNGNLGFVSEIPVYHFRGGGRLPPLRDDFYYHSSSGLT